ncbi:hypothetical protein GNF10_35315 [Nostoc sp. UCD121]|uniref:hypothetical protein n=1 Tax=unclassified Nostoc TaxID=2593658 RepID=UPI00162AD98F|nr:MULTISPECIES: hypothetical protein [unclassified Nostoc]MBC1225428.1 hypothetical protein [Nostoc sp. UCD120]MBC1281056.1 hypothetical protein [Nostoc sp. UCD121]
MASLVKENFVKRCTLSALACTIASAMLGVEFNLMGQKADALLNPILGLECVGENTNTYSPGLTSVPKQTTVTVNTTFTVCNSLSQPQIVSGSYTATYQSQISCSNLSPLNPYTATYNWNDGSSSTVSYTYINEVKQQGQIVITLSGSVIAGKFTGKKVLVTGIQYTLALTQCNFPDGVNQISGPVTLIFI